MSTLIHRQDQSGVAYLTLNRPQAYNSLSREVMQTLHQQLDDLDQDMAVRTVVIKGDGRGFCAGHDLKEIMDNPDEAFVSATFTECSALMQRITSLSIPVIAQVHGVATAAGCQLVASCDLALAADTARFGTPGVNIGLFCSTPMVALTRCIHPKHAMEMLLSGQLIDAPRAASMGLINRVVAADELSAQVTQLAELIASKSRKTLSIGKQAFNQQCGQSLEQAYQYCSQVMANNLQTSDAQEGIDAFLNKRTPEWTHR